MNVKIKINQCNEEGDIIIPDATSAQVSAYCSCDFILIDGNRYQKRATTMDYDNNNFIVVVSEESS